MWRHGAAGLVVGIVFAALRPAAGGTGRTLVDDMKVHIWEDAYITCRGQVFTGDGKPLVGCTRKGCGMPWRGCGYNDGVCVWESSAATVSKKPYCVQGICVEHAPGPSEKYSERCRIFVDECLEDTTMWAGPLEAIVVLTQPFAGAYYHFLIDGLTRIWWVHKQYPDVVKDGKTAFHTGMVSETGQTWARLMGIQTETGEKNRLIDGIWKGKKVYFPPGNACANMRVGAYPEAIQGVHGLVHERIVTAVPALQQTKKQQVVLVVRRDPRKARARAVLNHEEMVDAVKKKVPGWEIQEFTDFPKSPSIIETCGMFAKADLIMGPHGAGFSNLICAKMGTPVIEFQQKPHTPDYELLTGKLKMPYLPVPTDIDHGGPGNVDIEKVLKALERGLKIVAKDGTEPAAAQAPAPAPAAPAPTPPAPTPPAPTPPAPTPPPPPRAAQVDANGWDQAQPDVEDIGAVPPQVAIVPSGSSDVRVDYKKATENNPNLKTTVHVFHDALVSCKGQVFSRSGPLVGCGGQDCIQWDGCSFVGGTCVWNSMAATVSRTGYCVNGACVQHAPGPAEAESQQCRERTHAVCADTPGITGGPVEQMVVLTQPRGGLYHDFVVGSLSRLYWIHKQHPEIVHDDKTVFHTGLVSEAGQEWARLVGINTASGKDNRLVDGWWKAKVVYFPPGNGCTDNFVGSHTEAIRAMRRRALWQLHSGPPRVPTRKKPLLLIARVDQRKADAVQSSNQQRIVDMLRQMANKWAVTVVSDYPEPPSVLVQCSLFFLASVIVGEHGDGISNLVCARSGTPFAELQKKAHSFEYELLAAKLRLPYIGLRPDAASQDWSFDLQTVEEAVAKAVSFLPQGSQVPNLEPAEIKEETSAEAAPSVEKGQSSDPTPETTARDPEAKKVHIWHHAVVSCKGQVFNGPKPLVACGNGGCSSLSWPGCSYQWGTCVWDSVASHVTKKPYCLANGICVPHAPGPSETSAEACREHAETHPCSREREVVGGPLDTIVVLTQPQWGAYYHFLVDGLSRIVWIVKYYPEVMASENTFFHTGMVSDQAQAWAQLVGINTGPGPINRLLDGWWRAKTVYFPPGTPCANEGVGVSSSIIRHMHGVIVKSLGPEQPQRKKIAVLVHRDTRAAQARAVINYLDVFRTLKEALPGWKVKVFSDYPEAPDVLTTCKLFRSADFIVGMHGAGLSNIVCATPGVALLELQQMPHAKDFQLLSNKSGLLYFGMKTNITHSAAGNVDIDDLNATLRHVMSKYTPGPRAPATGAVGGAPWAPQLGSASAVLGFSALSLVETPTTGSHRAVLAATIGPALAMACLWASRRWDWCKRASDPHSGAAASATVLGARGECTPALDIGGGSHDEHVTGKVKTCCNTTPRCAHCPTKVGVCEALRELCVRVSALGVGAPVARGSTDVPQ